MFPPEGRERFLRLMDPSGPKVLRFDSGHRPLRVVVAAGAAVKKGARLTAQVGTACGGGLCRKVVFALLKGKVSPLRGDEYKACVTCLPLMSPVLHNEEP